MASPRSLGLVGLVGRRGLALTLALAALAPTRLARAQPSPATPSRVAPSPAAPSRDALSEAEVARRLAFLDARLGRGTAAVDRWWYGWSAGWMVLTLGQAAVAIGARDPGLQKDAAVGAAFSSLGIVPRMLPFPALHAAADLKAFPATTLAQRRARLAHGERLLAASATAETLGRSWLTHTLGAAASLAAGLVNVLVYKRPLFSGMVKIVGGMVLTEAQIFTQPTAAIDALQEYQATFGSGPPKASATMVRLPFTIVPSANGLGIAGTF